MIVELADRKLNGGRSGWTRFGYGKRRGGNAWRVLWVAACVEPYHDYRTGRVMFAGVSRLQRPFTDFL
jgi:hypothetical protein